jgi:hypothetical protein
VLAAALLALVLGGIVVVIGGIALGGQPSDSALTSPQPAQRSSWSSAFGRLASQ